MSWEIVYARQAAKDAKKLAEAGLKDKALGIIALLSEDLFRSPPPYEKLLGDIKCAYSRRINIQHRLVYQIFEAEKTLRVLRMWTHYE